MNLKYLLEQLEDDFYEESLTLSATDREKIVADAAAGAADAAAVVDHLGYPSSKTCKELKKTFFKEANAKREFYSKESF